MQSQFLLTLSRVCLPLLFFCVTLIGMSGDSVFGISPVRQEDGKKVEPTDLEIGDRIRFEHFDETYEGLVAGIKSGGTFLDIQYLDEDGEKQSRTFIGRSLENLRRLDPVRTWKSKGGKFKVTAALAELSEDSVTLRKEDGKTVKVPIEKLSSADQKFLKKYAARKKRIDAQNAWIAKPDSSKFSEVKISLSDAIRAGNSGPPLRLTPNSVAMADPTSEPIDVGEITLARATMMKAPAILLNHSGSHALLWSQDRMTRRNAANLTVVDLVAGKRLGGVSIRQEDAVPLDISPNGRRLITVQGQMHKNRIDIWEISSDKFTHLVGWSVKMGSSGDSKKDSNLVQDLTMRITGSSEGDSDAKDDSSNQLSPDDFQDKVRDALGSGMDLDSMMGSSFFGGESFELARFIDDDHIVTATNGPIALVWQISPLKVIRKIHTRASSSPIAKPFALSPDRKSLYVLGGQRIRSFDLLSGKMTGITPADQKFYDHGLMAISPDGSRLLIDARKHVQIVNSDGIVEDEFAKSYHGFDLPTWLDNRFYAVKSALDTMVIDTKYRIPIWRYKTGFDQPTIDRNANLWFVLGRHNTASKLFNYHIPHADATANLPEDPESLLVLKPGDRVRLSFDGSGGSQSEMRRILTEKMKARGVEVDDNGDIEINISIRKHTNTTTYETIGTLEKRSETVTTKSTSYTMSVIKDGRTVYSDSVASGGAPPMVSVREGQSIQSAMPKGSGANASVVERLQFPKSIPMKPPLNEIGKSDFSR